MSSRWSVAGGRYTLTLGDLRFEVDPRLGGRIASFRLGALDVLAGPDIHPKNWGSTFWTSPQSDWGWPPPAEFDDVEYGATLTEEVLALDGPKSPALGVAISKRFSAHASGKAIALEYRIHNRGDLPRAVAPWEISRVRPKGLSFHPKGVPSSGTLSVEEHDGIVWYLHDPSVLGDPGKKHFADGTGGYLAHVAGELLFIKSFKDVGPEHQAPGEAEIEVYANDRYVEVEVQGPYTRLDPGASLSWTVTWQLCRLPASLHVTPGALAALAASLAKVSSG
jgi:hypothetical protein